MLCSYAQCPTLNAHLSGRLQELKSAPVLSYETSPIEYLSYIISPPLLSAESTPRGEKKGGPTSLQKFVSSKAYHGTVFLFLLSFRWRRKRARKPRTIHIHSIISITKKNPSRSFAKSAYPQRPVNPEGALFVRLGLVLGSGQWALYYSRTLLSTMYGVDRRLRTESLTLKKLLF